jgi:hypothetical protein|tara:strand:+ start:1226 stop:1999 length:774 start_codon:yes stop_codon:yes gene_type:complete
MNKPKIHFFKLLFNEDNNRIVPEHYLIAVTEASFFMLVIGGIFTVIFTPEVFSSNPILDRLGYNNFCIGIDFPPANYFAFPMAMLVVYFAIQYSIYDRLRTNIVKERLSNFQAKYSIYTNNLMIIGFTSVTFFTIINPMQSVWLHTIFFINVIVLRALVLHANFLEHPNPILSYKIYTYLNSFVSFFLPLFYVINYINYDQNIAMGIFDVKPLIPARIVQSLDYLWFILLGFCGIFVQEAEHIKVKYKIISKEPSFN